MTKTTNANIDATRFAEQTSDPATPASGFYGVKSIVEWFRRIS